MNLISIIIPTYNESETIIQILEKVNAQNIDNVAFEIIVVDDGSKDNSIDLLEANPGLYTHLVALNVNGGKGAAVISGLRKASGDYVLFQDADMEYDPADYKKLVEPIIQFDADIVMGSRLVASPITRVSYFWHRVGNRIITLIFNILNNTTFTDVYSCYLLYRRDLVNVDDLRTRGWEQHAEILTKAVKAGKKYFEVPINYFGRSYEEGKKIKAHHIVAVVWTMFLGRFFHL